MGVAGSSRATLLLLVSALLAAAPASAHRALYRALGNEPFWSLKIGARAMLFEQMDMPVVRQPTPRAKVTRFGRIYWTRRIQVAIVRNERCSDGMSDYVYHDKVTVTVDARKFSGCGGPRHLPPGATRP